MKKVLISAARLVPAFLVIVFANCSGGEKIAPSVATTLAANSSISITGVAGAVVTPAPSVVVKDQNGSPMGGAAVTFAVVSGGGSVSGATVTSDASGIATVGSWTLGPVAGTNTLSATSGSLSVVTFTATSGAGTAASLAKNAGDNQSAPAGSAVPVPPSVIVKDAGGNPKSGVSVTFAVASGGGSVTGATASTNAAGIATAGSWTLGPVAGTNTLNATSGSLNIVTFTATSGAGAAASIAKNTGDNQSAAAGASVAVQPSVIVTDAGGNPKSGVTVTFAVVAGGGSITGATAATNAAGVAAVGSWTLGSSAGTNSLSATVAGLAPVTFTATGTSSLCSAQATHTFGTTSSGTLSPSDCQLSDGSFVDFYSTSVPQAGAYFFREGAAFDTYLLLAMPDGTTVAENDDETDPGNSGIKALLPTGNYLIGATSFAPGVTGDYQISSTTAPTDVANCETAFIVRNVTTAQNLATTDCNRAAVGETPIYADGYFIFLSAGTTVTVNMSSTILDSFLQLVSVDGTVDVQNDNVDGTTKDARITFTATQSSYYVIFARSVPTTAMGPYTLTIQ